MDRVEKRLRRVTAALAASGVDYAVIGGNAVAAWVGRVDPGATRATKDVDLLVRREDLQRVTGVIKGLGFERHDLRGLVFFTDPDEPSRRSSVLLDWADQKARPSYVCAAPSVDEAVDHGEGFRVLDLPALVRMKLTSFRDIDRVHVGDLMEVGLIDERIRAGLPDVLRARLGEVERTVRDQRLPDD